MPRFDIGIRKHVEFGQVKYWLLVTAKPVESEEEKKTLRVRFLKEPLTSYYLWLINAYYWKIFIICSIYLNTFFCVSFSWFKSSSHLLEIIILTHLTCLFYWIDFTGAIVERIIKSPNTEPRSYYFLIIDAISLTPISMLYLFLAETPDNEELCLTRAITALRFYKVLHFFYKLEILEKSRWSIVIAAYASYLTLLIILFANCFMHFVSDYTPISIQDWNETTTNKIVTSLYYTLDIVLNVGTGDIQPVSYLQIIINWAAMTIGFGTLMGLFNGILETYYDIREKRRENERYKYEATMLALKKIRMDKKTFQTIRDSLQMLWKYKKGITEPPPVNILPLSLQKEIFFDINFGFLNRSIIFSTRPRSFLRSVSLLMKNVTYLPGEIIIESGGHFEGMICVASGVIEILSDENDETALFSLTTGTILGEAKLFISIPNRCFIRASTYVEIQMLQKVSFSRLALKYPQIYKAMRSDIYDRLQDTKQAVEFERKKREFTDPYFKDQFRRRETKKFIRNLRLLNKENMNEEMFDRSEILQLYVLSENIPRVKTLPINLIRAKPWILRPETPLTRFWNFFITVIVLNSVLVHPILAAFHRTITPSIHMVLIMTYVTYIADLYLNCTTAIEKKDHFTYITSIKEIIAEKLKTFTFYLDILASYYLGAYADLIWPEQADYAYLLLSLNSLLKTWRLVVYMENLRNDIKNNLLFCVTVKYILCFIILTVWGASLLFLEACPGETCSSDRWFVQKEIEAIKNQARASCTTWPITMSFYFATSTLFSLGFGDIVPTAIADCLVTTLCKIVGAITLIFCVAEISSALKHLALQRTTYQEEIFAVERFMSEHEIPKDLQKKVQNYLRLQWDYDMGYSMKQMNIGEELSGVQNRIVVMSLAKAYSEIPLFRKLNFEFIKLLAKLSKVRVVLPNEYVTETGSFIRQMYIIQNGYCKVTHETENFSKIVGPGFSFGILEMILGTQQGMTALTLTHAKIISLEYSAYLKAITKYPNVKVEVDQLIENEYPNPEIYYDSVLEEYDDTSTESEISLQQKEIFQKQFIHVYHYYKNLQMDYWKPFRVWGKFRFFQYFLLPIAITPDGLFLKIWMGMRIVNVLIMASVAPIQFCFPHHMKKLTLFLATQQAFAAADLYLMFHVAYYDKRGLLMFHPTKTAINYLKGTFILDLITVFPYFLVKHLTWGNDKAPPNIFLEISGSIMALQLYKFFQGCHYLEKNILRKTEMIQILKFIPLSLAVTNFLTGFIILLECYEIQKTGNPQLEGSNRMASEYKEIIHQFCLPQEQINNTQDDGPTLRIYLTTFYWVTTTILGCGFGDINPISESSMICAIIIVVLGIFFYTYKFASISSSMVITNVLITKHRRRILRMGKFMREKKVRPALQKRFLLHYEHDWQRTEGATPQKAFTFVNAVLREKIVASMYEETVRHVPVFENLEQIILKIIGKDLNEIYFLGGETIVNYNDVQEHIYLIYRGKVNLLSQSGEIITSMGRGGLFGNISNKPFFLSSEAVIAVENVDVLRLKCNVFFQILETSLGTEKLIKYLTSQEKNYIEPRNDINQSNTPSIIKLNLNYVKKMNQEHLALETASDLQKNEIYLKNNIFKYRNKPLLTFVILPGTVLDEGIGACFFAMAYLSVALTVYSFAFQDLSTYVLILSYTLDFMFVIELYLQFHMSYFNRFGDCVISKKKIRKKYWKSKKIFYDIASNLPLEVLAMSSYNNKYQWLTILRLNRILRLYSVFKYHKLKEKNLMINKIVLELGWIIVIATLMVHFFACIWFVAVCPLGEWQKPTWATDLKLVEREKWELYIYSVYHIIIITTSDGLGVFPIYSLQELLLDIIFLRVCRLFVFLLTSLLVATINVQSLNLFSFQEKIETLKSNFKRQNLSNYIFEKMWNYLQFLWDCEKGKQMPKFILIAPYAMKCELMNEMFGSHLSQNYIFRDLNQAFLRQLAIYLHRYVYFSGNYIVQQGDIDDTMYFIHKGELSSLSSVSVLTIHPNLMETIHFVLIKKDTFGMRQGLITGKEHNFSFRAKTDVEILSLTLSHWQHLFTYFPDVEKKISQRLESYLQVTRKYELSK